MIKILKNNAIQCPKCKKYLEYEHVDIQFGRIEYEVYGCELNYADYTYIECPNCKYEIKIQ